MFGFWQQSGDSFGWDVRQFFRFHFVEAANHQDDVWRVPRSGVTGL
jgi:hypothetical protein